MCPGEDLLSEHDRMVYAARGGARLRRATDQLGGRPALLVSDLTVGIVGENRPVEEQLQRYPLACGDRAWGALAHIRQVLGLAREAGIPIIHTRQIYRAVHQVPGDDGSENPAIDPSHPQSELNPASAFLPETAPRDGEYVVEKHRSSPFFQTPLPLMLLGRGVDTLIIVGGPASGCIRATVVDASYYPLNVIVVEESTFDRLDMAHKSALHVMKGGSVLPQASVVDYLQGLVHRKGIPA